MDHGAHGVDFGLHHVASAHVRAHDPAQTRPPHVAGAPVLGKALQSIIASIVAVSSSL